MIVQQQDQNFTSYDGCSRDEKGSYGPCGVGNLDCAKVMQNKILQSKVVEE